MLCAFLSRPGRSVKKGALGQEGELSYPAIPIGQVTGDDGLGWGWRGRERPRFPRLPVGREVGRKSKLIYFSAE